MIINYGIFLVFLQLSSGIKLTTNCPDKTINPPPGSSHNSCYHFVNQSKTFEDAETYCRQHGGHLAKVDDPVTDAYLVGKSISK